MKQLSLKAFIKPGLLAFILMLVSYTGIWITHFLLLPEFAGLRLAILYFNWPMIYPFLFLFLLIVVNSILLQRFVFHNGIIRVKSFLPVFFYLMFTVTWPDLRAGVYPHLFLTVFIISTELFFRMYRNRTSVEPAFIGSLAISIISLAQPVYLIIFPLIWVGLIVLKCISLRVWLATITGISAPWIFFNAFFWSQGIATEPDPVFMKLLAPEFILHKLSLSEMIYTSTSILVVLISLGGLFNKILDDSIQTRKYIHILVMSLFVVVIFMVIFPSFANLFVPLTAFLLSILMAHPFTLLKPAFFPILFTIYGVLNLFYLVSQYLQIF